MSCALEQRVHHGANGGKGFVPSVLRVLRDVRAESLRFTTLDVALRRLTLLDGACDLKKRSHRVRRSSRSPGAAELLRFGKALYSSRMPAQSAESLRDELLGSTFNFSVEPRRQLLHN